MKILIFDSGPLINLSMNGLLYILEELKKKFNGKFIITEAVKKEVIDRPMNIEKYELGAIRIDDLLTNKVIELPSSLGIDENYIKKETERLMEVANQSVRLKGRAVNIVSEAEISCVALSAELNKKKIENIIAIDERTTRILSENPIYLERIISERIHHTIKVDLENLKEFKNHKFIRSSEMVFAAYKKGIIRLNNKRALEALLYATKFKGSSISFEEINELKKL